ncbi:MAG: PD-(D/E)XK nuclease family transposase [Coprobacillus sp.]
MYNKVSDFCSDYFFHYLMYHCSQLRLEICKYLTHDDTITFTTIENSDTYSTFKDGKKYVMDIVIRDDKYRYYNIEMQNGNMTTSDMKRFQVYAMRLIEKQMIGKETTHEISKVRQLIIYTGKSIQNFNHYQHKLELYDKRYQVLLEKGLITMNIIQIEKMEEEEMEVIRSDIHQVMRLFKNEEVHKEEQESPLAKEVVEIYKQFIESEEYYKYIAMERDRCLINDKMQEHYVEGREDGFIDGEVNGILKSINEMIKQKYQVDSMSWLTECDVEQLNKAITLIFKELTYEELKNQIIGMI